MPPPRGPADSLWRTRFGGDPSVVGRTAVLDGVPRTVMGVMPPGFDFPERTDLWLPLEALAANAGWRLGRGDESPTVRVLQLEDVTERTREMGIRIALGARPGHVIGTTISRMGTLVLAGVVVGTLGAYAAARLMAAWLYSVSPRDPATYAVSVLILVSVALIAALGPVRRATRVSPVEVLTE